MTTDTTIKSHNGTLLRLQQWLVEQVNAELRSNHSVERLEARVSNTLQRAYDSANVHLPEQQRQHLFDQVKKEIFNYGPIQPLLDDPTINEIMINGHKHVYIEQNSKIVKTDIVFPNDDAILQLIEKIIEPLGRRIDARSPTVDGRLPDGSRVNAVIPPVTIDGPSLTIRKFGREKMTMEDYFRFKSLTPHMAEFLRACVLSRINILISGGTGSGKTTLLNILSSYIPETERIVTIEDSAELRLHQEHVVRMEARPPGPDGKDAVPIRHLVHNALRMRPDRIIVGEVRGGEALDMLQAMNTGHDGSLTTTHANSPRDAISRLETLVLFAGYDLPLRVVREQIASAIDLVIQQSRIRDGSRKITSISEVVGMEGETVVMNELFQYKETGTREDGLVLGDYEPTGMRPMFEPQLKRAGFRLPPEMFGVEKILQRDRNGRR
jgi:pilus assembly protein CpaF